MKILPIQRSSKVTLKVNTAKHNQVVCMSKPEAESNSNRCNIKLCSTVISVVPDLTSSSKESVTFQCHMSLFPKFLPRSGCRLVSDN